MDFNNWEEIPDEALWQDGELNSNQLMDLLYIRIVQEGFWKVIRHKNKPYYKLKGEKDGQSNDR